MRQEFNQIYDNLFADYLYDSDIRRRRPLRYNEFDLARIIRRAIDRADSRGLLRPDAKYFLLVNFHHLIVRPMIESNTYRGSVEPERNLISLEQAIESDIQTIVTTSIENRGPELDANENQISGHEIMTTIDRIWKQLKTTAFDIWG